MSAVPIGPALVLLTLLAFALRVYGLGNQSLWLDEVDAIAMAGDPVTSQLRKLVAIGENGPLYFLIFKGWIGLAGASEFGARYLSCLASTLAVPLLGVLTLRLTRSASAAFGAAALGATSPYYVWFGQDAKMYPLYAALAIGAQYALLRGCAAGGWRWWAAYVASSSLALYIHIFAALQIPANTLAGIVMLSRARHGDQSRHAPGSVGRRQWLGFGMATALLVVPYVPLAAWQAPVLFRGANVGYRPTSLPSMLIALGEQLTWHLNPAPDRYLLLPLLGIALVGLWRLWRRQSHAAGMVMIWLVVPVLLIFLVQFTVPVFRDRYLIPLLVPLLIMFASALVGGPGHVGIVAALFLAGGWAYSLAHRPPNPDYRAAAALVRQSIRAGERVGFLAEYTERPFAFYYAKPASQAGQADRAERYDKAVLPYTNFPGMTEQDGLVAVARGLRGGEGLWIMRFEDWLWDARDLTTQYLRNRGAQRTLYREYDGVSVSRWEVP